MIYVQNKAIPIESPFYYATKGNARVLKTNNGEILEEKNAEFLKIDFKEKLKKPKEILNKLIFSQNYQRELIMF
jgi:cytosine/adenosine deaminase-related metal-dependent hydrolase